MSEIEITDKRLIKVETKVIVTEFYDQVVLDVPGGRIESSSRTVEGVLLRKTLDHSIDGDRLVLNSSGIRSCKITKDETIKL